MQFSISRTKKGPLREKEDFLGNRPTVALIDINALGNNYRRIRGLIQASTGMMAVVKANAYGHGDVEVSRELEALGCEFFGVAFAGEGARLREAGIQSPIVVLGGVTPEEIEEVFRFELIPVVYDIETAGLLNKHAARTGKRRPVHVKIDSGMGRLGLLPEDVPLFFRRFAALDNLFLEGMLSHFAETYGEDSAFSEKQLSTFLHAVDTARKTGCSPVYTYMANSAAIVDFRKSHFNLVRPGLMLYGVYPESGLREKIRLDPVLSLKTRILQLKKVPPGFSVSYGRTFVTSRESLIATIPIGYGDGLPRSLTGRGEVIVRGRRAPMVGAICMDLTMVDVTGIDGVEAGDDVVLIGTQDGETITAEEIAEKAGTIPYEVLCSISGRVPRLTV